EQLEQTVAANATKTKVLRVIRHSFVRVVSGLGSYVVSGFSRTFTVCLDLNLRDRRNGDVKDYAERGGPRRTGGRRNGLSGRGSAEKRWKTVRSNQRISCAVWASMIAT